MLTSSLQKALAQTTHDPELLKVMDYAVFPAGKMFRPKLVEALSLDLKTNSKEYLSLSSAIELHHAYTLVHDDLPPMDNDLMRRGKPSTHVAFGEWKAILAGDALLIASFHELMKIKSPQMIEIHRLFTWATGAKGLILGQFLDLDAKGKASFQETIRIHELKTGRLIQVATLGCYFLSEAKPSLKAKIEYLRLGREIGVSFQLLDDLSELAEGFISPHEREINPFITSPSEALNELQNSIYRLGTLIKKYKLVHVEKMLGEYFRKSQENLNNGMSMLESNLHETSSLADLKIWITNFSYT
ncbi:MAG TPA: polyprenyl synthetase family protein [Bacteriovoracaceae bacterium]|nr:polyprenyl synthetase family protein [Bacteriovoracaceae bacterium]